MTVSVDTTGLALGDHALTVSYGGADNFESSQKDITLTLTKAASTVTAADQTATYGSAGSLTATVTANPDVTGTVTFSDGATTLGQADVGSDGTATLALPEVTLDAGTHTITAAYGGSDTVTTSTTTFTLTVSKAPTTVVASDVVAPAGSTPSVAVTVTSSAGQARRHGQGARREHHVARDGHARRRHGHDRREHLHAGQRTEHRDRLLPRRGQLRGVPHGHHRDDHRDEEEGDRHRAERVGRYGQTVVLPITVKGSAGTPTGHVQVLYGSKSLGSVTLVTAARRR